MDGIMVSAATGVMNSLLCKLTTMLEEEYKLNQRVKCHITFLKDELSSMAALLEKLSEKEKLDPQMEEWRDQVREMAYDIEDCIDKYMHQVHQMGEKPRSIMGLIFKYIDKVMKLGNYNDIVEQIQDLKARVIEAGHRRKRYKVDLTAYSNGTGMVAIDPRLPALYAEASGLVGIDGPRNEIIKMVRDDEQLLKVVSILGLGGLGKTTLANQVYRSIIVAERFEYRAFVCVSQKPDMRNIFRTIFSQLAPAKCLDTAIGDEEECLINEIRNFLKDKRYFVVIDDVWNSQVWKIIKCALLENLCGSRIIVTTRIASVAKACCFSRHHLIYQLRPLSESDSKSLFFRRTFGHEGQCPPHLIEVSAEIIKKCGGLPLAILTMSSLLNTKSDRREEWVRIQNSIGLGLEKNPDVEEMRRILSLSYTDLPPHLKTCLLYLSMYPEDNVIHMQNLVRRWIAEGFVKVTSGRNLMEEGECYFNELINRSLIQPAHMRYDGKAMACHVHDMILEFIVSKAVEENFITFCSDKTQTLVYNGTVRRLYIDHHNQENVLSVSSIVASHIRSLSIFGYSDQTSPISDFQALRVVYINSYRKHDNSHLKNIGRLFQLRYLCIEEINVTQLPEQIGELHFLETLDIFRTAVYELPASIVELQHLKHLYSRANLPEGIGKMKALEELGVMLMQGGTSASSLKELGNLTKLRTLNLSWFSFSFGDTTIYVNNFVSSLTKLGAHNLQVLNLLCAGSIITRLNYWSPPPSHMRELNIHSMCSSFCGIPQWMASPANLTKLCISVNQVKQSTLQILGSFPALLSLELTSKEAHEMLTLHNHGFRHLKVFRMINPVMGFTCKAGAMPKLEELTIEIMAQGIQSAYYHYLDLGIHHLSALKELTVSINYKGAKVEDVEALKAVIRNAAALVPNLRKLILYTSWEDFIRSSASSSSGQGSGGPRMRTNDINGIFSLEVPSILRTQLSGTKLEHQSISKMQWRWR